MKKKGIMSRFCLKITTIFCIFSLLIPVVCHAETEETAGFFSSWLQRFTGEKEASMEGSVEEKASVEEPAEEEASVEEPAEEEASGEEESEAETVIENAEVRPVIQAHAGASALGPENTLAAMRASRMAGVEGIETDVRMTKDGQLVIRHDDVIDWTSNGHGRISEMTLEELKSYDFGSWYGPEFAGEQILTLSEFLDAAEDLGFSVINLEMKPSLGDAEQFIRTFAEEIRESGLNDRIMVSSFDWFLLKKLKEAEPDIHAALITLPNLSLILFLNLSEYLSADKVLTDYTADDVKGIPSMIGVLLRGFGAKGDTIEEMLLEVVRNIAAIAPENSTWNDVEKAIRDQMDLVWFVDSLEMDIDYLNCHHGTLTAELLESMKERGILINVWTPDTSAELERAIGLGPYGIITNEPVKALELIRSTP